MRRGMQGLALQVQESLKRDPHAGDLYIFRGRRGDLAKILWHDGIGLSLYAKRLDRGKFIWPSASGDAVSISAALGAIHNRRGGRQGRDERRKMWKPSYFGTPQITKTMIHFVSWMLIAPLLPKKTLR
jgi:transposase